MKSYETYQARRKLLRRIDQLGVCARAEESTWGLIETSSRVLTFNRDIERMNEREGTVVEAVDEDLQVSAGEGVFDEFE